MRHTLRTRRRVVEPTGVTARVRIGGHAATVTGRLEVGDIAVLDHIDLDRRSAQALLDRGVGGVVNAAPCISGRYPALGAQILVSAGVPLLDDVGPHVVADLRDGRRVTLDGELLLDHDLVLGRGHAQDAASVAASLSAARGGLAAQTESLVAVAAEVLRRHPDEMLDTRTAPPLRSCTGGRPVLLVSASPDAPALLRGLRPWIAAARPLLVGLGAGGQLLQSAGYRVEVAVGWPDEVGEQVLAQAADLVVPVRGGAAPVPAEAGVALVHAFCSPAGGEVAGLLLAESLDAPIIVTVGALSGLVDLLDGALGDAASVVLARLRVGRRLVDAATVAALHRRRVGLLLAGAMLLVVVAAAVLLTLASTGDLGAPGDQLARLGHHAAHVVGRGWHRLRQFAS